MKSKTVRVWVELYKDGNLVEFMNCLPVYSSRRQAIEYKYPKTRLVRATLTIDEPKRGSK